MSDGIDKIIVGQRIKNIRLNLGLTQAQFADKLFIANNVLCGWEKGRSIPNASIAQTVAEFGGMNASDLLNTEPNYKKMWRTLKEDMLKDYVTVHKQADNINHRVNEYMIANIIVAKDELRNWLKHMDYLDSTDEFLNLKRDLERNVK